MKKTMHTYPSGKTDVIDESKDIGRAQIQHGQHGLWKKIAKKITNHHVRACTIIGVFSVFSAKVKFI